MSPIIQFSEEDINRNKVILPGWYEVVIERVGQKPSKGDNPETTTIWPIDGKVVKNADNGDTTFAGVPTPAGWGFNDNPRAKGFMIGFFQALGVDVKGGARLELSAAEGKHIEVFIENDSFENRIVNRINHKYRPLRNQ